MFRLVDAPAALAARGWPERVTGAVDLELHDAAAPWNAGRFRLELADGKARVTPGGSGTVALGPGGLAALFAGALTPPLARRAGLQSGGDERSDAFLTAAFAGPRPGLLDYF